MRFILTAITTVLDRYRGNIPLASFLQQFFRTRSQLGARDRRAVSQAVFLFFRYRHFFPEEEDRLQVIWKGLLHQHTDGGFLKKCFLKWGYQEEGRQPDLAVENVCAHLPPFSKGITPIEWLDGIIRQPNLFIRLRGRISENMSLLHGSGIAFQTVNLPGSTRHERAGRCLSLPNSSRLDSLLPPMDYVVQDYASQAVMALATDRIHDSGSDMSLWDVCAGAGGKTLYWRDIFPQTKVLASDIRNGILKKLNERVSRYGQDRVGILTIDAANASVLQQKLGEQQFDYIICDVPCSGSGTWGRTPEHLHFFERGRLPAFQELQVSIATNARRFLKPGGIMFYITCSVFRIENEDAVEQICSGSGLDLLGSELISGTDFRSDSMFLSILKDNNQS